MLRRRELLHLLCHGLGLLLDRDTGSQVYQASLEHCILSISVSLVRVYQGAGKSISHLLLTVHHLLTGTLKGGQHQGQWWGQNDRCALARDCRR